MKSLADNRYFNSRNNKNNNMAIPSNDQYSKQSSFPGQEREFLLHLWQAYCSAKKGKKSVRIDTFDIAREQDIMHLFHVLTTGEREPGIYTAFIIKDPVCREIFAAPFTDRIVHHLIHNYLAPLLEPRMCYDSYGARAGKGIHFGVQRVQHFIRSCKQQYKQARIMKIDIKNFFHSIDHDILAEQITDVIAQHRTHCPLGNQRLNTMTQHIITHNPIQDAIIVGKKENRQKLPIHKSLFGSKAGTGLPLGNITSQLFANRYLNPLDHFIKHSLKVKGYGRYMDDMLFVHHDKDTLLQRKAEIQRLLTERLHLTLHPKKLHLQQSNKGVTFIGYRLHDRGISLGPRIISKRHAKIRQRNHRIRKQKENIDPIHVRDTMNTYLGRAQYGKNHHLRKKMYEKLDSKLQNELIPRAGYLSLRLRKRKLTSKQYKTISYDSPELFF